METRIYQKENNHNIAKLLSASISDMFRSHFLAKQLAVRDIKGQYRESFLGMLWLFVMPVATALTWVFLSYSDTVKLTETNVAYPVYVFTGTFIWSIIKEAISSPTQSTNASKGIISKINFPKEALILTGIYKLLFNSSVKVLVLFLFVIIYGVGFHWSQLFFPLVILAAVLFGTTLGLFITPISMLYNDVSKLINMGLGFLMYITPVVYAIPKTGFMKTLMEYNPFTPFILTARDMVTGLETASLYYMFGVLLVCIPIFLIALVVYRISIPIIIERSGA